MSGPAGFVSPASSGNVLAHEWNLRLDTNFTVVAYSVLVYDFFCTFGMEVNYVWGSPWSFGLPLFYVNRYLPMINLIIVLYIKTTLMPGKNCQIMGPIVLWISTIVILTSQLIIALRTYALWGGKRFLLYFLIAWGLIFPGTAIVLSSIATHEALQTIASPLATMMMKCPTSAASATTSVLIFHLMTLVGEIIIVTLTGIKAKQHMNRISPWLQRLYHNGILQCFTMLTFSIVNTIVVLCGPAEIQLSIVPLQCNLHSIFCTRIILLILKHGRVHNNPNRLREARQSYTGDIGSMYLFTSVVQTGNGTFGAGTFPERQAQSFDTRPELDWNR